ncbi:MAG: preprotein translocase subunit YajC, partial [Glaciihabitans sp.]|nr:preprotein translocase subunit YajC [Glaciihabitans sp.]
MDQVFNIALLAVLAVLVFFMFRNNKKRKAAAEDLKSQIVPGAEIMTNFGLFGKLLSVNEVTNEAEVET